MVRFKDIWNPKRTNWTWHGIKMFLVLFCSPLVFVHLKTPSCDICHGFFNMLFNKYFDLYMESAANSVTEERFTWIQGWTFTVLQRKHHGEKRGKYNYGAPKGIWWRKKHEVELTKNYFSAFAFAPRNFVFDHKTCISLRNVCALLQKLWNTLKKNMV